MTAEQDLNEARNFVALLAGSPDAAVTLVALQEGKPTVARRDALAVLWPWVVERQRAGFGIYVTVNETASEARTKGDITRIRAVWIDDDTPSDEARTNWAIEPHLIVESSPGKRHYYWLTDAAPDPVFEDVMRAMIAGHAGADKGVFDISRVLRLPGTLNLKAAPYLVRVVHRSPRPRYDPAELIAAFPTVDTIEAGNRASFDLSGALQTIESAGPGLHDALRGCAAYMASRGVPPELTAPWLTAYAERHSDGTPRCRSRIAEIPGLVASAAAKFLQPETIDGADPLDLFATAYAQSFGFTKTDYPPAIGALAADISARMGCDPLIPAWTALAACAGLLPDRLQLQVKFYDDTWREAPRLWLALVGDPSSKKSPPMSAVLAPIERLQSDWAKLHEVDMARWRDECAAARRGKTAEPREPSMPRVLAHDATTESLALVLHTTPAGMLVVHDELSGWFGAHDAYRPTGTSKDRAFWLQAYNGAPFVVDRVKSTIHVPHLSVSMVGGIQPGPMREIAKKSGEDGLLQRFIVLPTSAAKPGRDIAPDAAAQEGWGAVVAELSAVRENPGAWPTLFKLSPAAQQALDAARHRLDQLSRSPALDRRLAVALAKGEGQLARLVLVYHLLESRGGVGFFGESEPEPVVSLDTTARAVRVFFDLVVPAQFDFYSRIVGESEHQQQARRVAGYILAHELDTITDRAVYREALKELREDERGRADVMRSLELAGWLAPAKEFKGRVTQWTVNPRVHSKYAVQAVAEQARRRNVVATIRSTASSDKTDIL